MTYELRTYDLSTKGELLAESGDEVGIRNATMRRFPGAYAIPYESADQDILVVWPRPNPALAIAVPTEPVAVVWKSSGWPWTKSLWA